MDLTPKLCNMVASWAIFRDFRPLFCLLSGSRQVLTDGACRGHKVCFAGFLLARNEAMDPGSSPYITHYLDPPPTLN